MLFTLHVSHLKWEELIIDYLYKIWEYLQGKPLHKIYLELPRLYLGFDGLLQKQETCVGGKGEVSQKLTVLIVK